MHQVNFIYLVFLPPRGTNTYSGRWCPCCVCEWCPFPVHSAALDEVSAAPWLLDDLSLDGLHGTSHWYQACHSLPCKISKKVMRNTPSTLLPTMQNQQKGHEKYSQPVTPYHAKSAKRSWEILPACYSLPCKISKRESNIPALWRCPVLWACLLAVLDFLSTRPQQHVVYAHGVSPTMIRFVTHAC